MLPELPRVLKHKEADFGLQFRTWVRDNWHTTATFELKQSQNDSIPFSCLEEHQIRYNLAKERLVRVQGTIGEPDMINLINVSAFIVIKFKSGAYIISIEDFLLEKKRSQRKSLTSSRAQELACDIIKFKKII